MTQFWPQITHMSYIIMLACTDMISKCNSSSGLHLACSIMMLSLLIEHYFTMLVQTWSHHACSIMISPCLFHHDFTMLVPSWFHHACSIKISPCLFHHDFTMLVPSWFHQHSTLQWLSVYTLFQQGPSTSVLVFIFSRNNFVELVLFQRLKTS